MRPASYYNDFDPQAAAWLRELIRAGEIPDGEVDERSIIDVRPDDLRGFIQCHFFAGIGGWPYALRLARIPEDTSVWTGSPPCQPFSVAGKQEGKNDERHLSPHFLGLVGACRPRLLFGEQVASAEVFGKATGGTGRNYFGPPSWAWLDDLFDRLEAAHYAAGASDIPAAGIGAPHIRQRTFFGAVRLADSIGARLEGQSWHGDRGGEPGRIDPDEAGSATEGGGSCWMADHQRDGRGASRNRDNGWYVWPQLDASGGHVWSNSPDGQWGAADWLYCRDGKWRPVEPGTFPLAHGVPGRVGLLRGYGNAIVPQAAAEFVMAFLDACKLQHGIQR